MTTEQDMIVDDTQPSLPPRSASNPTLSMLHPKDWDIRIKAAFAMLPPLEYRSLRKKFLDGLALEYSYVASLAGTTMILHKPPAVSNLIRRCAGLFIIDDEDQIEGLDILRDEAFQNEDKASDIDQDIYQEEWWNELSTATFPCSDYLSHKRYHQRLLEWLRSVRELTQLAHDKKKEQLQRRAKELNILTVGYDMMKEVMMPNSAAQLEMMDCSYGWEFEGGRHLL